MLVNIWKETAPTLYDICTEKIFGLIYARLKLEL